MSENHVRTPVESVVQPLQWDTDYFGIRCGRAILSAATQMQDVARLCGELKDYGFVSIQNAGNDVGVNRMIAQNTPAYLVDINVQFEKLCGQEAPCAAEYPVTAAALLDEQIRRQLVVEQEDFAYSKFVCDPEMRKRSGYKVYEQWLANAGQFETKYFIYHMDGERLAAYILFNLQRSVLTVELVKVNAAYQGQHIGSDLMNSLEAYALGARCKKLRVGTQLNNIPAINLYHRLGYRDVSRTSVYHYWSV